MFSKYPCLVILPILLTPVNIVVDPSPNLSSNQAFALSLFSGGYFALPTVVLKAL